LSGLLALVAIAVSGKVLDVLAALGCELQIKRPDGIVIVHRADASKADDIE
jgi:HTH-type transcriptional regulator / antitoxin HipB